MRSKCVVFLLEQNSLDDDIILLFNEERITMMNFIMNEMKDISSFLCFLFAFYLICSTFYRRHDRHSSEELIELVIKQLMEEERNENVNLYRKRLLISKELLEPSMRDELLQYNIECIAEEHLQEYSALSQIDAVIVRMDQEELNAALELKKRNPKLMIYAASETETWDELVNVLNLGMNGTVCAPLNTRNMLQIVNSELFRKYSK